MNLDLRSLLSGRVLVFCLLAERHRHTPGVVITLCPCVFVADPNEGFFCTVALSAGASHNPLWALSLISKNDLSETRDLALK